MHVGGTLTVYQIFIYSTSAEKPQTLLRHDTVMCPHDRKPHWARPMGHARRSRGPDCSRTYSKHLNNSIPVFKCVVYIAGNNLPSQLPTFECPPAKRPKRAKLPTAGGRAPTTHNYSTTAPTEMGRKRGASKLWITVLVIALLVGCFAAERCYKRHRERLMKDHEKENIGNQNTGKNSSSKSTTVASQMSLSVLGSDLLQPDSSTPNNELTALSILADVHNAHSRQASYSSVGQVTGILATGGWSHEVTSPDALRLYLPVEETPRHWPATALESPKMTDESSECGDKMTNIDLGDDYSTAETVRI